MSYFPIEWKTHLNNILLYGKDVSPRGIKTKEIPQHTLEINMRKPVLTIPERKLSYCFMAAEAYWILSGDNKVETLSPFNKNIAKYSDDGKVFFGAYGPRIKSQLKYVVDALEKDNNTRQAGLTIWRENPPVTKDVPCTVSIFFSIRNALLNCHVFMRSSDVWLGIPYDVFNFSMLAHNVCCLLEDDIRPGTLYLTAASSHLYSDNFDAAINIVETGTVIHQPDTPGYFSTAEDYLLSTLAKARHSKPNDPVRWWEVSQWNKSDFTKK